MIQVLKPKVIKTISGINFFIYPEFIMEEPFQYRGGCGKTARLVRRIDIASAFHQGLFVETIGDRVRHSAARAERGRFHIGCMYFAAPQTKIIRKWALA